MIHPLAAFFIIASAAAEGARPVQRHMLYQDGPLNGCRGSAWNMIRDERDGGATPDGRHLWLNADWLAKPWAGLRFVDAETLTLDKSWIEHGFVRFLLNATVDRYGHPAGELELQVKPDGGSAEYVQLPSRFIDRGRGRDEDETSWQEVLMPLALWRNLQAGDRLTGLNIQTRHQATLAFGIDEVGFVRFDRVPDWYRVMRDADFAQPWVAWPDYDELPDLLKADRHPPSVQNGAIVRPDGSRVFLLNPYTSEDQSGDLGGGGPWGLYDAEAHGWIYEERLTLEALSRLGFNSLSVTMSPSPWWKEFGYNKRDHRNASLLPETRDRTGVPFYVDTVCWPYTLGVPAVRGLVDKEAITQGRNHWTPYRITGQGREIWLHMWRFHAERFARNEIPVVLYELLNEPSYAGHSRDHLDAFAGWLKRRYRGVARLNSVWGSDFADWHDASHFTPESKIDGRTLDYDEFLAEQFAELVRHGGEAVREQLPDTLVGVQTMGGYVRRPREAVWKHKFVAHETAVLTPTGGGTWSPGGGDASPPARALDAKIAASPFENDLLLSLAGNKMIIDNEFYCRGGMDARAIHDQLWRHVIVGLDGVSTFSWAKRGWAWHDSRDKVINEAENYPYSMLNPAARPTASLRGIHDFAAAIQPVSHLVLPKPWGPRPQIALVHSWANVRYRTLHPELQDKTEVYHQALRYSHWNTRLLPSDRIIGGESLGDFPVVIIAGVTHVEPGLVPLLERYVRNGGMLVIGEARFDRDIYDKPVTHRLPGVEPGEPRSELSVKRIESAENVLPGRITIPRGTPTLGLGPDASALLTADDGAPVVTHRPLGKGKVYYQAADAAGYELAKLLWGILEDAGQSAGRDQTQWRLAELRDGRGQLATNILVSRRSHEDRGHHAILMMNQDRHIKDLRLRISVDPGPWRVHEHLAGRDFGKLDARQLATEGIELSLEAGRPAVLLLQKRSEPKQVPTARNK